MKLSKWAEKEGIAYITAWRWFKHGKLPVPSTRTPSGTILVQEAAPLVASDRACVYARVSSHEKKADLDRQAQRCTDFCATRGWQVERVVKEVASGMNDSRPRFLKLLASRPARIVVEHKDRMTRFGFRYLEELLPRQGTEVVVINRDSEEKDDLMKDLVAIITSFCCRLYGLRRGHAKAKAIESELQ